MDSPPPPHSAPPNKAVGAPPGYSPPMSNASHNASSMIVLNPSPTQMIPSSAIFSYSSMIAPATLPSNAINAPTHGGSHSESLNVDSGKKKRGRPRKYVPDGGGGLGLVPTTTVGHGDLSGTPGSEIPAKKPRGRPAGSGKKPVTISGRGSLSLHSISAKPGEDVAAKVLSFSQQGPRTVFIISAYGTIQSATLRHVARVGGFATVGYEVDTNASVTGATCSFEYVIEHWRNCIQGPYDMISMSGCFVFSENNGIRSKTGSLSVLLGAPDGRVFGGGVAGMLMAGSQVQVLIGSFLEDDKKSNPSMVNSGSSSVPSLSFLRGAAAVAAIAAASSSSSSGESSADNGGSPVDNRQPGMSSNSSSQPMHNTQHQQQQQLQLQEMYHKLWAPR